MAEFFDILVRFVPASARTVTVDPVTGAPWLRLEQAPLTEPQTGDFQSWFQNKYGADFSKYNWAEVMAYWEEFRSLCSEEGDFQAEIWVHKSSASLVYRLDATRGTFTNSEPVAGDDQKTEHITVDKESSYTFSNENIARIVCAQWEGNVYDEYGVRIYPRPAISAEGSNGQWTLSWDQKVIGSLRVVKVIEYDIWYLTISPRDTDGSTVGSYSGEGGEGGSSAEDNSGYGSAVCVEAYEDDEPESVYAATVYGVYSGGVESLEVRTPDLKGNCGKGTPDDDDEEEEEEPQCYERRIKYHKCTGEIISDEVVNVPCPEE